MINFIHEYDFYFILWQQTDNCGIKRVAVFKMHLVITSTSSSINGWPGNYSSKQFQMLVHACMSEAC